MQASLPHYRRRIVESTSPVLELYKVYTELFPYRYSHEAFQTIFQLFGFNERTALHAAVVMSINKDDDDDEEKHYCFPDDEAPDYDDEAPDDDDHDNRFMPYISLELGRLMIRPLINVKWDTVGQEHPGFVNKQCVTINRVFLNFDIRRKGHFNDLVAHLLALDGVEAVLLECVLNKEWANYMLRPESKWICQDAPETRYANPSFVMFRDH